MKITVLFACISLLIAPSSSVIIKDDPVTERQVARRSDKRDLLSGNSLSDSSASQAADTPGIVYAGDSHEERSHSPAQLYATPSPHTKISDVVLEGQTQIFSRAIADQNYSPVQAYQPIKVAGTKFAVSEPVESKLAYVKHQMFMPIQAYPEQLQQLQPFQQQTQANLQQYNAYLPPQRTPQQQDVQTFFVPQFGNLQQQQQQIIGQQNALAYPQQIPNVVQPIRFQPGELLGRRPALGHGIGIGHGPAFGQGQAFGHGQVVHGPGFGHSPAFGHGLGLGHHGPGFGHVQLIGHGPNVQLNHPNQLLRTGDKSVFPEALQEQRFGGNGQFINRHNLFPHPNAIKREGAFSYASFSQSHSPTQHLSFIPEGKRYLPPQSNHLLFQRRAEPGHHHSSPGFAFAGPHHQNVVTLGHGYPHSQYFGKLPYQNFGI